MPAIYTMKQALTGDRSLGALAAGKALVGAVKALLESPSPSDELQASVEYHALCCERVLSPECFELVCETVSVLRILGKLPKDA